MRSPRPATAASSWSPPRTASSASPFKAGYVAAKHGVLGLVKMLALEGADVGISASALCPGYVRTPLVEAQSPTGEAHGLPRSACSTTCLAPQAVKRLLEPSEVAAAAASCSARRAAASRARRSSWISAGRRAR